MPWIFSRSHYKKKKKKKKGHVYNFIKSSIVAPSFQNMENIHVKMSFANEIHKFISQIFPVFVGTIC